MSSPSSLLSRAFTGRALACRRGDRLIFEGLDFDLAPGGALLLGGPNGSGKTSLLRLMAGLTPPESGALAWDGIAVGADPAAHRARLHFIGHQDGVKPTLTVAESLRFWAGMRGSRGDVGAALERFGLETLADLPCRFLSAGQRHRLALARLLASAAPLWLLDEPAASLDERASADLYALLAEHRASGGSVVLAAHGPPPILDAARLSLAQFAARRTQ